MSKKLLEESTIRSFMKLANLQPLTDKFLKESAEEVEEEQMQESAPPGTEETLEEETLEEETLEEEGDVQAEGKESEGRPSSPKPKVKGVAKPGKVKGAHADHKMKAMSTGTHHSDKPDSIETKNHSNAPKKNNSQFEVVSESLEEEMDEVDAGPEEPPEGNEMDSAGESPDHKEKMKGIIRDMLNNLKDMGSEYGMSMEISDQGGESEEPEGGPEAPEGPPEGDKGPPMMEDQLDEIVEKLTKRVASRLVKETKKKR